MKKVTRNVEDEMDGKVVCDGCGKTFAFAVMEMHDGRCLCAECASLSLADDKDIRSAEGTIEENNRVDTLFDEYCDCCGKRLTAREFEAEPVGKETLCRKCREKAIAKCLGPEAVRFLEGGLSTITFEIDWSVCKKNLPESLEERDVLRIWRTQCVDFHKVLDGQFDFFVRRGSLSKGPVFCLERDNPDADMLVDYGLAENTVNSLCEGKATSTWLKIKADQAVKLIKLKYKPILYC